MQHYFAALRQYATVNVIPLRHLAMLVVWALKGTEGDNRFGPAPAR